MKLDKTLLLLTAHLFVNIIRVYLLFFSCWIPEKKLGQLDMSSYKELFLLSQDGAEKHSHQSQLPSMLHWRQLLTSRAAL